MGLSSEWAIELHNEQLASDAGYAEDYFRQMAEEEAAYFEWDLENEQLYDWFDDRRLDFRGYEEADEPQPVDLVDEDLPF